MRELADRYEHEDDAMTRAEIAMEMASAYLKDQAERQQPIDAEWLRGLEGAEVTLRGANFNCEGCQLAVKNFGVDWEAEAEDQGGECSFLCTLRTRGQLLDLLAGLRGEGA